MGDKTELIRSELDKRRVDWWCGDGSECSTLWVSNGITWEYTVKSDGEPNWIGSLKASEYSITPEQAIQATLGHKTCYPVPIYGFDGEFTEYDCDECSECGTEWDGDTPNFCPWCGAKVVNQ